MAPNWNKIGEHLVRGKHFYTLVQTIEALKLDIYIDEKGVCLQFQTEKVKIPHVELQDFYLPQSILAHFLADSKGYIDLSKYNLPFIHVLPSTKKARILSVSKEIPARCPFQNYDQLRRHWKNMYGYTLPKNKDEVFYYEIKFPMPKSIIYTYPNVCIMAGPVNVIHTRDCEPTINHFLTDMLNLLPNIFGKQFQISHYKTINTESVATYTLPIMCPILSENKELLTQSGKQNDPSSSLKLQFSAMCGDRLPYTDNAVPTSLIKTDLAKIHHIHNTVLTANANCTLNNQNINSTQNVLTDISISSVSQTNHWTAQTVQGAFNSSKDSTKCDINESVKEEESISKYFKRQKSRHLSNSLQEQFTQKGKLKNVTLKQKLLNNMCDGSKPVLLQNAEYHVDVEVMAKNNKLGEVKNSVLSNWLKERFIPHNPQAKKAELINKVLSHMRNTQMLKQFRM